MRLGRKAAALMRAGVFALELQRGYAQPAAGEEVDKPSLIGWCRNAACAVAEWAGRAETCENVMLVLDDSAWTVLVTGVVAVVGWACWSRTFAGRRCLLLGRVVPPELVEQFKAAETPDELLVASLRWLEQVPLKAERWRWKFGAAGEGVMVELEGEAPIISPEEVPRPLLPDLEGVEVVKTAGTVVSQQIIEGLVQLAGRGDRLCVVGPPYGRFTYYPPLGERRGDNFCESMVSARRRGVRVELVVNSESSAQRNAGERQMLGRMQRGGVAVRSACQTRDPDGEARSERLLKLALLDRESGAAEKRTSYTLWRLENWTADNRGRREWSLLCRISPEAPEYSKMMMMEPFEGAIRDSVEFGDT